MVRLKVKEVAEEKGYNMSSLSRKSDVHFNTIKRIFKEPNRPVGIETLEKIAKALDVKIANLIDESAE
jgi:DNA-binding Xre family transcriptional regulator